MNRRRLWLVGLMVVSVVAVAAPALAQTGVFDMIAWSINGGAATSRGGAYTLSGTIGQADAGQMEGGDFVLGGGFWGGGVLVGVTSATVFLPLILR